MKRSLNKIAGLSGAIVERLPRSRVSFPASPAGIASVLLVKYYVSPTVRKWRLFLSHGVTTKFSFIQYLAAENRRK